jgi:hypothetical protein
MLISPARSMRLGRSLWPVAVIIVCRTRADLLVPGKTLHAPRSIAMRAGRS